MPADSPADRRGNIIATGYLANARRFGSYEDARYPWHLTIEDTLDVDVFHPPRQDWLDGSDAYLRSGPEGE